MAFPSWGCLPKVLQVFPWGHGVFKEEASFPYIHYDHHFLTRLFLVSRAIVLACLGSLTRGPGLTIHPQGARQSVTEAPNLWVPERPSCCLVFEVTGSDPEPPLLFVQELQTLVFGKWREAHFAQTSSIKSQFATRY